MNIVISIGIKDANVDTERARITPFARFKNKYPNTAYRGAISESNNATRSVNFQVK